MSKKAMRELIILPTKDTPEIILKPDGIIKIKGRSTNRYASKYFKKIEDWVDKYVYDPADLTCVDICPEYFNVSNIRVYFSVLKKIESIKLRNKKYIINWYYEEGDEDILETGEYISSHLNMPFNFIRIKDPNFGTTELSIPMQMQKIIP
jgi:hypothetical protein